jgi:AcrR family transcriptional regulator
MKNMAESRKDVREIIINVARGIFGRFGFRKTTMDEIAQAAHKGKSSIYHYFKSKEEVFQAVVEKESYVLKEEIAKAIKQQDTPQKKLRAYVMTRMQILNRLANYYSALRDEYLEHYSFIEKLREKHLKDEVKMIKQILKKGVEQGIFSIENLELTAQAIVTALKGFEYPWIMENDVSKTKRSVDSLLGTLFHGIITR